VKVEDIDNTVSEELDFVAYSVWMEALVYNEGLSFG
jgi:hypothetical protein